MNVAGKTAIELRRSATNLKFAMVDDELSKAIAAMLDAKLIEVKATANECRLLFFSRSLRVDPRSWYRRSNRGLQDEEGHDWLRSQLRPRGLGQALARPRGSLQLPLPHPQRSSQEEGSQRGEGCKGCTRAQAHSRTKSKRGPSEVAPPTCVH